MQELGASPYPFTMMISMFWVCIFLLLGIILRVVIPPLRKYLIPACMIGGLLGCILFNVGFFNFLPKDWQPDSKTLEMAVFHMFNLSFICFGLSGFGSTKGASKKIMKNASWIGVLCTGVGNAQFVLGIVIIFVYNSIFGTHLLESAGYLMNQGFLTGPGAAMAAGAVWEQAGYQGMISLGLAFAAMGYIASIIVGVPAANYIMHKKGMRSKEFNVPMDEQIGVYKEECRPSAGSMRFMPSNVDSMSFQLALILSAYGLAFILISALRPFLPAQLMGIFWSMFAFFFCLPCGIFVRMVVLKKIFKAEHLFDMQMHTRLLNILVDFIAVASLIAIQVAVLHEWWTVMLIGSLCCSFLTLFFLYFVTRKHKEFGAERFLGLLGNYTGTITTGLVLIRMVDPEYKSTVPYEMGLSSIVTLLTTIPLMPITLPFIYGQVFYGKTFMAPLLTAAAMCILYTIVALLPFWKMNQKEATF